MNYREAKAKAEEIDKTLTCEYLNDIIYIEHLDGTKLELHHATLIKDGQWFMIFTEHNGTFVYHNEDLKKIEGIKSIRGETLEKMDADVENFKKGIVGEPIDIDEYMDEPVDMAIRKGDSMKTVAIEDLIISTILTFCENSAELGCPRDKEVDMWFRELSYEDARKVVDKMMEIEDRNSQKGEDGEKR